MIGGISSVQPLPWDRNGTKEGPSYDRPPGGGILVTANTAIGEY